MKSLNDLLFVLGLILMRLERRNCQQGRGFRRRHVGRVAFCVDVTPINSNTPIKL